MGLFAWGWGWGKVGAYTRKSRLLLSIILNIFFFLDILLQNHYKVKSNLKYYFLMFYQELPMFSLEASSWLSLILQTASYKNLTKHDFFTTNLNSSRVSVFLYTQTSHYCWGVLHYLRYFLPTITCISGF